MEPAARRGYQTDDGNRIVFEQTAHKATLVRVVSPCLEKDDDTAET
jgi:hypothetical protein